MSNLFSTFDPHALMGLSVNWLATMMVIMFIIPVFWISTPSAFFIISQIIKMVKTELNSMLPHYTPQGFLIITLSTFMLIFLNNFMSLFPYIFSVSSHPSFGASLAIPLWVGYMVYGFTKNITHNLAHFLPLSTPTSIMPFMVIIEMISSIIRPLTLFVRLTANMVAGHLLMTLFSSLLSPKNMLMMPLVFIPLLMLSCLELFVSFIQSYVFSTLMTLYTNENNTLNMT